MMTFERTENNRSRQAKTKKGNEKYNKKETSHRCT